LFPVFVLPHLPTGIPYPKILKNKALKYILLKRTLQIKIKTTIAEMPNSIMSLACLLTFLTLDCIAFEARECKTKLES
jgi:hypothetical protein